MTFYLFILTYKVICDEWTQQLKYYYFIQCLNEVGRSQDVHITFSL